MGRPRFRQLPHIADVRLVAWGENEGDLISNAVLGTVRIMLGRRFQAAPCGWSAIEPWPRETRQRVVRAANEAVFLLLHHRLATVAIRLGPGRATLGLTPLPPRVLPELEVKAVTYHALRPQRRGGRLRAVLTLDL